MFGASHIAPLDAKKLPPVKPTKSAAKKAATSKKRRKS